MIIIIMITIIIIIIIIIIISVFVQTFLMSILGIAFRFSPTMRSCTVFYFVLPKPVKSPTSACFRSCKAGSAVDRYSVLS